MLVAMAESDWFPTVVDCMSVASMVALGGTCRGMVAGHVASPQARAAEGRGMLACDLGHLLVVSSGGNVHSFGGGGDGRLGHGFESQNELVPRRTEALDRVRVVGVAAGSWHSMALAVGGDVYIWGRGYFGQLGHGDNIYRLVPTKVDALQGISGIACGYNHSMAVLRGVGSLFLWGSGSSGQLGLGDTDNRQAPTIVPALQGGSLVAADCWSSFSLGMDGTVMAWDPNIDGELGLGDVQNRLAPTMVKVLCHVVDIAAGYHDTIAVTLGGHLHQ